MGVAVTPRLMVDLYVDPEMNADQVDVFAYDRWAGVRFGPFTVRAVGVDDNNAIERMVFVLRKCADDLASWLPDAEVTR